MGTAGRDPQLRAPGPGWGTGARGQGDEGKGKDPCGVCCCRICTSAEDAADAKGGVEPSCGSPAARNAERVAGGPPLRQGRLDYPAMNATLIFVCIANAPA